MLSRTRIASALTAATVAAIAVTGTLIGAVGSAAGISGTPGRAAPLQVPSAAAAALQQAPAQTNSVFTPIRPCRAVDTRPARIAAGATKHYHIRGTAGFPAQGGTDGGCGVPAAATGVTVSVSSVNIAGTGYLRLWPYGQTDPGATVAHYQRGPITTTGATLALAAFGSNYDINARAFQHGAGLVLDITGYYQPQIHGMVAPASPDDPTHNAPIYAGSTRILSATNTAAGVYVVTFDSDISYCTPVVDTYNAGSGIYGAAYAFGSTTATVFTWFLDATGQEVLNSYYFYIEVVC